MIPSAVFLCLIAKVTFKYKKIKDILLQDIKSKFTQNEIKQKIYLNIKEEYQTLVDKTIIVIAEKEIEFFKIEISFKNQIIHKFLNNETHKNNK